MYRAVLVDDETYDLEGLRRLIPWAELGIEVVCSENMPLAALSYIDHHPIDILVTDIKMPVLTGLELSRKALQHNPALRTIFISGYQDFEYAKQALDLKAEGYVLKPVDDDEIAQLLRKVVTDLDAEGARQRERTQLDESFAMVRGDMLQRVLEGRIPADALPAFVARHSLGIAADEAFAVVIELDDTQQLQRQREADHAGLLADAADKLAAFLEEHRLGPWCSLPASQFAFVYAGEPETLERKLSDLSEHMRLSTPYTITSSYGEPAVYPESIYRSYAQAKTQLGNKMFLGKNRVIPPSYDKLPGARGSRSVNAVLDETFAAMAGYDLVKICDCLDELFDNAKSLDHPQKVYVFSIHVASKLETYLGTLNETFASLLGWDFEHLDAVRQFETADDIQSWLRRALFEISERLFVKKQGKSRRLIEPIEQYIQEHMAEELTLREIAGRFSYSANHMGLLFKDQTGESFNEYLSRIRLEKAKALLRDSTHKIYEVADRVGYKSLAYFSRLFKEQYGISPGDYRKQS